MTGPHQPAGQICRLRPIWPETVRHSARSSGQKAETTLQPLIGAPLWILTCPTLIHADLRYWISGDERRAAFCRRPCAQFAHRRVNSSAAGSKSLGGLTAWDAIATLGLVRVLVLYATRIILYPQLACHAVAPAAKMNCEDFTENKCSGTGPSYRSW